MIIWIVIAASWLATAMMITVALLAARRSAMLYGWFFGSRPTAEMHQFTVPVPQPVSEHGSRLVA